MKQELEKLKEAYCATKSDKKLAEIHRRMTALAESDSELFTQTMVELARDTAERATEMVVKERLKEVLPALSMTYIAKTYFKKTSQWLYQRLNGNEVNGKPARFTPNELETLEFALKDISKKTGAIHFS